MDEKFKPIKLVVIGDQYTGKTFFIVNLINGYDSLDFEEYRYTNGASYCSKRFCYNNKEYSFDVWDTAGAEKYITLVKFFFRDADIVFVFFECGNKISFEIAKSLVQSVKAETLNHNVAIILVGNKYDLNLVQKRAMDPLCDEEEILNFADENDIPFTHISIKEKYANGVNELFKIAIKEYLKKTNKMK